MWLAPFIGSFAGCLHQPPAPVAAPLERSDAHRGRVLSERRPRWHVVRKDDTLYGVAWNYGLDFRDLARWNRVGPPYTIYPGQRLGLHAPGARIPQKADTAPGKSTARAPQTGRIVTPPARKDRPSRESSRTARRGTLSVVPLPRRIDTWSWPAEGRLVRDDSPIARRGINITGSVGQQVRASAAGTVVYSGSGLVGYGKLIIIKHNNEFLSAYAHNSEILVKEGEEVDIGQQIGKMGRTAQGEAVLHFEIRRNGKPEDPLAYLPVRRV